MLSSTATIGQVVSLLKLVVPLLHSLVPFYSPSSIVIKVSSTIITGQVVSLLKVSSTIITLSSTAL
jgi:hypothetical protein